jgi:hypothetical protein
MREEEVAPSKNKSYPKYDYNDTTKPKWNSRYSYESKHMTGNRLRDKKVRTYWML